MGDGGFDFRRPPPGRREPRRFEPPPWERGAFDELDKKRAEEQEREEAERAATQDEPEELAGETDASDAERDDAERRQVPRAAGEPIGEAEREAEARAVDEKAVIEMMAELRAEEPRPDYSFVEVAVGWLMVALGAVLIVWAMAAFVGAAKTGLLGRLGGVGLGLFGAFFFGMGLWMVYRAFKQRGVL